jgi:BirA family biotin operon repressor/biotin-[acetyl-CoA-carboxylase] ligase
MSDALTGASVAQALRGRWGRPLRVLGEVPSTQDVALSWAADGAPEGALVVADHQTRGRGRRGRAWASAPGRAVQLSLVLRPRGTADRAGRLTTALGLAVADAVTALYALPAAVEWPNDVAVEGRKLAGVLVETRFTGGRWDTAVAGVGINVAWACTELPVDLAPRATSIACERERRGLGPARATRPALLADVLVRFESLYPLALGDDPDGHLMARAAARSGVLGRTVVVRLASGPTIEGVAVGLLESGALEVDTGGARRSVDAGHIERVRTR